MVKMLSVVGGLSNRRHEDLCAGRLLKELPAIMAFVLAGV
jgi:hypothetical protein